MSVIYILIPIAILLTILGIYLFFWAVRTEQFDDLEKQGMSILFDDKDGRKATPDSHTDEIKSTSINEDISTKTTEHTVSSEQEKS